MKTSTAAPYQSNPFVPAITVVGQTLKDNGISLLQIVALLTVVFVGSYLVFVAGLLLSGVSPFFMLLLPVALAGLAYWGSRFTAALIRLWDASADGLSMSWREAYADTRKYVWRLVGLTLLQGLILLPAYLLFIIPGMYFAGRFALATPALVTEDLSIREAIRRSWGLSRGHVVEILGAMYGSVLLGTNGLLALNYVPSSSYGRYRQLASLPDSDAAKGKIHWLNWLFVIVFPILGTLLLVGYINLVISAVNTVQTQTPSTTTQDLYK